MHLKQEYFFIIKDGKDEFYRYCGKERRTYVEFLYDFNSCKIPLNILIELIGHIKPREFSISKTYQNKVENINHRLNLL